MTTGLVLGKFAPLHRGHQFLIETALSENDQVVAIIYNATEVTSISLETRANWIRKLYPTIEVLEAWDGPTVVGDTPEIKQLHEEYIRKVLNGRTIEAFYSSEFYGEHVSQSLNAVDRRLDKSRDRFPISGTLLRTDPYRYRDFVDPLVYRDLITKVVFLGAPSTGKTTIAWELARRRQTVWMPEYGREYWEKHQENRRLSLDQLEEIAEGHLQREDQLFQQANREIFIDTDASTTYLFSLYYHGEAKKRLTEMAANAATRYDLFFLCETDIPYDDTWDRSGEANRDQFQTAVVNNLIDRHVPFIRLAGNLEDRIQIVESVLKQTRHP
jgi:HTH-type transcriptional repressor of NAD biosynthesis genes